MVVQQMNDSFVQYYFFIVHWFFLNDYRIFSFISKQATNHRSKAVIIFFSWLIDFPAILLICACIGKSYLFLFFYFYFRCNFFFVIYRYHLFTVKPIIWLMFSTLLSIFFFFIFSRTIACCRSTGIQAAAIQQQQHTFNNFVPLE